jgi:phosphatidate cytidylyltransferase
LSELKKRVIVALIGIPIAVAIIILGGWYFKIAVLFLMIFTLNEYINLVKIKISSFNGLPLMISSIAMFVEFALIKDPSTIALLMILTIIFLLIVSNVFQLLKGTENGILAVSASMYGLFYIGFTYISIMIVREFNLYLIHWRSILNMDSFFYSYGLSDQLAWGLVVLFAFLSIWACDSSAYFIGSAYGKNKLLPAVSPKKSKEGAYAGLAGAVIAFAALCFIFVPEMPLWASISSGLVIGIIGQIGDLAESLIKRDAGVKDSSNLLPGHGGILDRFDSALFVFPTLVFLYFIFAVIGR